eukprot:9028398-Pyramimonas_sp.AAC.1
MDANGARETQSTVHGGRTIYVSFNRKPIRIRTPLCSVPYGFFNVYKNGGTGLMDHTDRTGCACDSRGSSRSLSRNF